MYHEQCSSWLNKNIRVEWEISIHHEMFFNLFYLSHINYLVVSTKVS